MLVLILYMQVLYTEPARKTKQDAYMYGLITDDEYFSSYRVDDASKVSSIFTLPATHAHDPDLEMVLIKIWQHKHARNLLIYEPYSRRRSTCLWTRLAAAAVYRFIAGDLFRILVFVSQVTCRMRTDC